VFNNEFSHGDFLNDICKRVTDAEFLIVFDIDCIPVNKKWMTTCSTTSGSQIRLWVQHKQPII
jgi:hypothetical protein